MSHCQVGFCLALALSITGLAPTGAQGYPDSNLAGTGYGADQRSAQRFDIERTRQWFQAYDAIRRQAQMTPSERMESDQMLSQGMAILIPGPQKTTARIILNKMVVRYKTAALAMRQLPMIPETEQLHRGYYRYFVDAMRLFSDYLKVQDNIMAPDPATGEPIAGQLIQRKEELESLNNAIQALDRQTRAQLGIPAYAYQFQG